VGALVYVRGLADAASPRCGALRPWLRIWERGVVVRARARARTVKTDARVFKREDVRFAGLWRARLCGRLRRRAGRGGLPPGRVRGAWDVEHRWTVSSQLNRKVRIVRGAELQAIKILERGACVDLRVNLLLLRLRGGAVWLVPEWSTLEWRCAGKRDAF
jgi:hypothetical protein